MSYGVFCDVKYSKIRGFLRNRIFLVILRWLVLLQKKASCTFEKEGSIKFQLISLKSSKQDLCLFSSAINKIHRVIVQVKFDELAKSTEQWSQYIFLKPLAP